MSDISNCVWIGPIYEPTGYADEGRGLLFALEQAGVPIALRAKAALDADFAHGLPTPMREVLERQQSRALANPFVLVQHYVADGFVEAPTAAYNVGRTMFETDSLPPNWVAKCNRMDELWVPSSFNVETFRRAGVRVPMHVVPGGIDTDLFSPDVAPREIPGLRGTVYLSVFEWRARKAWDVLLRAWANAFSASDDVTLVLRTHAKRIHANLDLPADAPALQIERRIDAFLRQECGRSLANVAPIVVLTEDLPADAMPSLYRSAHAFVSPTRGEGWGRPFMEAMSTGVPVIATRWSAHLDYMNDENSLLIETDALVDVDDPDMRLYDGHRWAAPQLDALVSHLRAIHDQPDKARALGARARADMVAHWPWSRAATIIAGRLHEIAPGRHAHVGVRANAADGAAYTTDAGTLDIRANVFAASSAIHTEPLLTALVETLSVAPRLMLTTDSAQRPPRTLPAQKLWECLVATPADADATADTTLSALDIAHPLPQYVPAHGRWIVYTGTAVRAHLSTELAAIVRAHADEVWVPHHAAYAACLSAGIEADRLWMAPSGCIADRVTPDATQFPRPRDVRTMILLPVLDAADIAGAELVLRVWQRVVTPSTPARLQLLVANDASDALVAWGAELTSRMLTGRLAPGLTAEVLVAEVNDATLPSYVRAADVVIVPGDIDLSVWHTTLACGRALVVPDTADAEPLRDAEAAWVVRQGAHGMMAGADLMACLRELLNALEVARRGGQARRYAEGLPSFGAVAREMTERIAAMPTLHDGQTMAGGGAR